MTFGIRHKLFILSITLLGLLVSGMSVLHYFQQWKLLTSQTLRYQQSISQSLLTMVSKSIAGDNYANMALPGYIRELQNISSLLYFEVTGTSDNLDHYEIAYSREQRAVWRKSYPAEFKEKLSAQLERLESFKLKDDTDLVKIEFLKERARDELESYKNNISLQNSVKLMQSRVLQVNTQLDTDTWTSLIKLNTINKNNGSFTLIYDISELKKFRKNILNEVIIESIAIMFISFVFLYFTLNWIIYPIENLAAYLKLGFRHIDYEKIPGQKKNDEVGKLSRNFKSLLQDFHETYNKLNQAKNESESALEKVTELSVELQTEVAQRKQIQEHLNYMAMYDHLTDLPNRSLLKIEGDKMIASAKRHQHKIGFLFIDFDDFKKINDSFGHEKGDAVLVEMALIISDAIRDCDILGRLGGDEFIAILPNCSSVDDIVIVAQRMIEKTRQPLESMDYQNISLSIGISVYPDHAETFSTLISLSDKAMYQAKSSGKNKLFIYQQN